MPFDTLRGHRRIASGLGGYLRANRGRIAGILALLVLPMGNTPARAAAPSLRIWTANDHGAADLLPGSRVFVVIELRSAAAQSVTLAHTPHTDLTLEQATASAGNLTPGSRLTWSGEVSATRPINLVLIYRVPKDAKPGDRTIRVSGLSSSVALAASTLIRVCCTPAPSPTSSYRLLLPIIRR